MKIQYYNKIRWGLAPLAPNDAPPLQYSNFNIKKAIHVHVSTVGAQPKAARELA
jgi:hypothetical protein